MAYRVAGTCARPSVFGQRSVVGQFEGALYLASAGSVAVVGPDVFDLDRDGDGIGCE